MDFIKWSTQRAFIYFELKMEKNSLDRSSRIKYNISRNTEIINAEKDIFSCDDDIAVKVYKALGESTRLQIVKLLAGQSELACLEMAHQLKVPANSTLTHHLKPYHYSIADY
ncbi:helix-turn-helix transcriptional regulator [Bacillus sp. AFS031507]|uniref:ArsR/SmtB family transcription factor n=1 Tax=Bacillus sp. AFS031507 TaxID=2033496 RepID=UPI002699203D|nr:hypothetical protein [Bacillus sp. AFS031507]